MEGECNRDELDFLEKLEYTFQSLFLWRENATRVERWGLQRRNIVSILVFMEGECNWFWLVITFFEFCFNPCFYGGRMQLIFIGRRIIFWDKFQSLFLWRENATPNRENLLIFNFRFNPCFYGGRMQQYIKYMFMLGFWPFQSLFLWRENATIDKMKILYGKARQFQSLFLWRENATIVTFPFIQSPYLVSILVFMEGECN